MDRFSFKGCPRCGGDLIYETYTTSDSELFCLQCGNRPPIKTSEMLEAEERFAKFEELRELAQSVRRKKAVANG